MLPGIARYDKDGLTTLVNSNRKASYATTTTQTMISQMNKFVAFLCRYYLLVRDTSTGAMTIPPVTAIHLIYFMGYLELAQHTSYASIQSYCSTVRVWCRSQGRPDPGIGPITNEPHLIYYGYCRAIKRKLAGKITKRVPITLAQLELVLEKLQSDHICSVAVGVNMKAALTMAFSLMLRISEYTSQGNAKHEPGVSASRGDVEFFPSQERPEGFHFNVQKSKTDQFRVGCKLTVYAMPDSLVCPVRAMKSLFDTQPAPPSDPLFNFGATHKPKSSRILFTSLFVKLLKAAGISTDEIKPHSLRSGGATAYLAAGVDTYVIQKLGRWASWCFTIYTQLSTTTIKESQIAMAHGPRIHVPMDLTNIREDIHQT